jgi:hypothetical protein
VSILDDPDQWRERAREARTIAEATSNPNVRRSMLFLAAKYDLLVKNAKGAAAALEKTSMSQ